MYYDFSGYGYQEVTPKTEAKPEAKPMTTCGACGYKFTPTNLPIECPNCWDDEFPENFNSIGNL